MVRRVYFKRRES